MAAQDFTRPERDAQTAPAARTNNNTATSTTHESPLRRAWLATASWLDRVRGREFVEIPYVDLEEVVRSLPASPPYSAEQFAANRARHDAQLGYRETPAPATEAELASNPAHIGLTRLQAAEYAEPDYLDAILNLLRPSRQHWEEWNPPDRAIVMDFRDAEGVGRVGRWDESCGPNFPILRFCARMLRAGQIAASRAEHDAPFGEAFTLEAAEAITRPEASAAVMGWLASSPRYHELIREYKKAADAMRDDHTGPAPLSILCGRMYSAGELARRVG